MIAALSFHFSWETGNILADCSGHSMQLFPVKNLIREEDGVGCSVRGTACLICWYVWRENPEGVGFHVDYHNLYFWNEKLENVHQQQVV